MNALPAWDDEQRLEAAPALDTHHPLGAAHRPNDAQQDSSMQHDSETEHHVKTPHDFKTPHDLKTPHDSGPASPATASSDGSTAAGPSPLFPGVPDREIPGSGRGAALAAALQTLDASGGLADAVAHLLAATDAADADAGIVRVDTRDVLLQQRIARIVSGAGLPSRGPGTRAREILALLLGSGAG